MCNLYNICTNQRSILETAEAEPDIWLTTPWDKAKALQRNLPDDLLG
jgi:putative SOS response-associated peptidase YedK